MKLWEAFLDQLEDELGKETVNTWLRPLKVAGFDAGNIYLDSPDAFQIQWFKEHVAEKAKERLALASGRPIKVHLRTHQKTKKVVPQETIPDFPPDSLDPDALIENLIINDESLAHKVISQLITGEIELSAFNPITICGPEGSGKTHLLMAVAHALTDKKLAVRYVTGETFTRQVVRAFRFGGIVPFRNCYRSLDVLLVDDIDFLSRKWATQEELFHTFNALHTEGKQIIVASRALPTSLEDVEQRLVSRFEWGINAPTTPPDLQVLATAHLARHDLVPDENLIDFLVTTFPQVKSLLKAITALALRLHVSCPINAEMAQNTLRDLIKAEKKVPLTPELIIKAVARQFDLSEKEILGKGRKQEFAVARQVAMYLCRNRLKMPFTHIGRFFTRDHSTVMSSVKLVERDLEKEKGSFAAPLEQIDTSLLEV